MDMNMQDFLQQTQALSRGGIRPLPVHVTAVIAEYAKNPEKAVSFSGDMVGMITGIKAYQAHPFRREMSALETVWQEGEVRLFFHPAEADKLGTILLLPSMINRSEIMDLLPGRSFLRWLAGAGFDVYMIDWGDPVRDEGMKTLNGVLCRVGKALSFLYERNGRHPFDTAGYCMGGTLLAAAAQLYPEIFRKLVFLASPWDFHAGDRVLADHVRLGMASALQMIDAKRTLPSSWIQSIFAIISADRTAEKFSSFAKMDQESEQAILFVAAEDWLNGGADFPGEVARECIIEWYNDNRPGQGRWVVEGHSMDPARINVPALVVASAVDRLVPLESSLALAKKIPSCNVMTPAIGHIGMMTGRRAAADVWRPVADWILSG